MSFDIIKMDYMIEHTKSDREKFLSLCTVGSLALFIYSGNLIFEGKREKYTADGSVRAIAIGGRVMAPIDVFSRFYSAKVNKTCQNVEISLGNKTYTSELYESGGAVFVDFILAARALGFFAESFYENRLVMIGERDALLEIKENFALQEAGAYSVFGEFDAGSFTKEDYAEAREAWRERLVGGPEINDVTDSFIKEKIDAISERCEAALAKMNFPVDGTDPVILFGELHTPTESEELTEQYSMLSSLAMAYGTYGSDYYGDKELLSRILYGLRWMYENMYGEAEIEERGWRSARAFNWWHWFCGASDALTDILIIIYEHISISEMAKYLRCFKWVATFMRTAPNRASASSRLKPCTKMALLLEDAEWLRECHVYLDMLMSIEEYGEGLHKDYCQWTHAFPHNIAYGLGNLHRTLFTSSIMAKTKINLVGPKQYNQFSMMKYTFEPAVYNGQAMLMFCGRGTAGKMMSGAASLVTGLLPMIGVYGEDEDLYIKKFIKSQLVTDEVIEKSKAGCPFCYARLLKEIIADASLAERRDYEYAHSWFTGDRAAQHRSGYAVGIALSSERECAYECINGQNQRGWHTGDGATYLYTTYDPQAYDGDNFLAKNVQIAYRIPGTTEDSQAKEERSILAGEAWKNPTAFAGSMQIEDKYILAAMEFIAMNFEGPDKEIEDTGYGTGLAVHHNDLKAKKAWFCFDREIVMLGSGITSTMNSSVHTTVEHRRLVSSDDSQYLGLKNGSVIKIDTAPTEFKSCDIKWALMPGHAGYAFPYGASLCASRYVSAEADMQEFVELSCEHGKNPSQDTYIYAILPYATVAEISDYASAPEFRLISNTEAVAAVAKDSLGIECFVFYKAGESSGIEVSEPMLVTRLRASDGVKIKLSDPTHKLSAATVRLSGRFEAVDSSSKISLSHLGEDTLLKVDFDGAHGRTYDVILKER